MNGFRACFAGRSDRLVLPTADKDQLEQYVAKQSVARGDVESVPFPRQVDFWAFSICAALAMDLPPKEGAISRWGTGFVYAYQGILDEDISALLAVVATAKMGHENPDVDNPGKIIELANRPAGAGCPFVLRKLSENTLRTTPLDRVISLARSLQEEVLTVS
jgi:hypothetical protein